MYTGERVNNIIGERTQVEESVYTGERVNNMQMLVTLGETVKAVEVLWCGDWEALYLDIKYH